MIAENIAVKQQEELVRQIQENVRLLKKNNATQEELVNAQKALNIAQKAVEIAKEIAKKKDSHYGFDSIAGYDKEKYILTEQFINLIPYEKSGADISLPKEYCFWTIWERKNKLC